MDIQPGHIAVVTGAGTGIGRELARQLSATGVHVSMCDVAEEAMAQTAALCRADAPAGTRVHTFRADVSREPDVLAFRDAVIATHASACIQLLFNNAGIGGGGSFVDGDRDLWERTFAVCWFGVYHAARAFLPLLVASRSGCIVNVSSVNGFWASLGPATAHTAYSSAKFAVKGFTEALITDLRLNAPHVSCALVMPGHIGTEISMNSLNAVAWTAERLATVRRHLARGGVPVAGLSDEVIRQLMHKRAQDFRDQAPTRADQAATVILDGVRAGRWRILVGDDAEFLDRRVREDPEGAYEAQFAQALADAKARASAGADRPT